MAEWEVYFKANLTTKCGAGDVLPPRTANVKAHHLVNWYAPPESACNWSLPRPLSAPIAA